MLNSDERSKHPHKGTLRDRKNLLLSHHTVQRHHQKHVLHLSKLSVHILPSPHHSFTDAVDNKHLKFYFDLDFLFKQMFEVICFLFPKESQYWL